MSVAISRDSIHREYARLHQSSLASLAHLRLGHFLVQLVVLDLDAPLDVVVVDHGALRPTKVPEKVPRERYWRPPVVLLAAILDEEQMRVAAPSEARRIFNGAGGRRASQKIENNVSLERGSHYRLHQGSLASLAHLLCMTDRGIGTLSPG